MKRLTHRKLTDSKDHVPSIRSTNPGDPPLRTANETNYVERTQITFFFLLSTHLKVYASNGKTFAS